MCGHSCIGSSVQETPDQAMEIQKSLEAVSAQAAGLQVQLGHAQEAIKSSQGELAAACARESELRRSAVTAEQERAAAAAQVEELQVQVRDLEGECEALESTVEELQEACEGQATAHAEAEEQSARTADSALQALQAKLEQVRRSLIHVWPSE